MAAFLADNFDANFSMEKKQKKMWKTHKVTTMNTKEPRLRKDSGFSEGSESPRDDHHQHDLDLVMAHHWDFTIHDWSVKCQSIVSQEVEHLRQATKQRVKQLKGCQSEQEREEVCRIWHQDLASTMMATQDLIECLASDFLEQSDKEEEENSKKFQSRKSPSKTLGKILEGKLDDKLYLLRTNNEEKEAEKPKEIIMNGNVWKSQKSFTIQVEELGKSKSGCSQWVRNEKVQSPVVWNEDEKHAQTLNLDPEDIFHEWNRQKLLEEPDESQDINNIFWKICLEHHKTRPRRISEVLDNLSFQDHPDLFEDRCDILENFSPNQKKGVLRPNNKRIPFQRKNKPVKFYWNIFNEWKHNFEENGKKRRCLKRRIIFKEKLKTKYKKKRDYSPSPPKDVEQQDQMAGNMSIFGKDKSWYHHPKKYVAVLSSNDDSSENSKKDCLRRRRRSREEYEAGGEGGLTYENPNKKLKKSQSSTWSTIQYESSKCFDALTKNIEQKIREAFRQESFEEKWNNEEDDWDGMWPLTLREKKVLKDSRHEFINLRDEVRQMRKDNQKRMRHTDSMDFFHDWNWNLLDITHIGYDDIFDGWKTESVNGENEEECPEQIFADWRHNLIEDCHARRRLSFSNFMVQKRQENKKLTRLPFTTKHEPREDTKVVQLQQKPHRMDLSRKSCAMKHQRQMMRKCFPNQPRQRGIF